MLSSGQFTGQEPIITPQEFNTNSRSLATSEHDGSAFNSGLRTPTEPSQNQRGLSEPYGIFPQTSETSTPFQGTYNQHQGTYDQSYSIHGPAHPMYGVNETTEELGAAFQNQGVYDPQRSIYGQTQPICGSTQTAQGQGDTIQNQGAFDYQEGMHSPNQEAHNPPNPVNGQDQPAHRQNPIYQIMTRRGRLLRAEIDNPPHLSRPRNSNHTIQHSPPRRPYHEPIHPSPPPEPTTATTTTTTTTPSPPTRAAIYTLRIANLEATKKLTLSTFKAYGAEIKALEGDLELGWSLASANENLRVLYTADVRLMELRRMYADEGKRFRRLGEEIEATWEDFVVVGEERGVMGRDFETL